MITDWLTHIALYIYRYRYHLVFLSQCFWIWNKKKYNRRELAALIVCTQLVLAGEVTKHLPAQHWIQTQSSCRFKAAAQKVNFFRCLLWKKMQSLPSKKFGTWEVHLSHEATGCQRIKFWGKVNEGWAWNVSSNRIKYRIWDNLFVWKYKYNNIYEIQLSCLIQAVFISAVFA